MSTGHVPFSANTSYGVLRQITDQHPPQICEVSLINRDPIDHKVKVGDLVHAELTVGGQLAREFAPTTTPIAISCEFHPWCRSYFLVQDHPYVTVTDQDGAFHLDHVPSGTWRLRFWHELAGPITRVVTGEGQVQEWPEGRVELVVDRPQIELGEFVPGLK